jgi:hypothetical protein
MSLVGDRGRGILPVTLLPVPTSRVARENCETEGRQMDHQTFDRLTRLIGTAASRRTAWRALLGAALFGATRRSAAAEQCRNGKPACGNDGCCPGRCFAFVSDSGDANLACKLCCTEKNDAVICGDTCCKVSEREGEDPCRDCIRPTPQGNVCSSGIAGSYRRR